MSKCFVSIVIPIYNGISNGIQKCMESIWNQPLNKDLFEVICVDDCSTDDTLDWLYGQKKYHDNLKVIANQKNVRQGGSRNAGFRVARGKYIALIDQDDYYHDGALLEVYNHLKDSDLEILIVDCAYQSPGKVSNKLQHNFPHREVMTGDEIIMKNSIPYAPWKFIFLRSLVIENNLYFCENERIEDVDWSHILVHYGKRVQYQPILFVHYNKNSISTTMSSYKNTNTTYSTLRLSQRLHRLNSSVFKDSKDEVKRHITWLRQQFFYLGVRNFFFIYDKPSVKAAYIRETACGDNHSCFNNKLASFAVAFPLFFSIITNVSVPFSRILMKVYRTVKYA